MDEYNALPSKEALHIEIEKRSDLNEETWKNTQEALSSMAAEDVDERWLVNVTERYCKDRAIHLAVLEGIHIINGDDKTRNADSLPDLLSNALSLYYNCL